MRGGKRSFNIGCAAIITGIIIILAIVLPSSFWWFALAVALIAAGIWYVRCCWR